MTSEYSLEADLPLEEEHERENPTKEAHSIVNSETEENSEVEEITHWLVVDKKTGRSYLGSKSFPTELHAQMMLKDLLKYHQHTEWAERLVVLPGKPLKKRETQFSPQARNLLGRPKGCKGNTSNSKPRPTGVEWNMRMGWK